VRAIFNTPVWLQAGQYLALAAQIPAKQKSGCRPLPVGVLAGVLVLSIQISSQVEFGIFAIWHWYDSTESTGPAAWGGVGYLPRGFVLLWGCRIGHTAQFVCSAEGLISSLSLIADGENQELGPI
jgi:hypothetical protein